MKGESGLQFLKLGGSLITDKSRPHTPRLEALERLAGEIAAARRLEPSLHLILGHGSGSFGHIPASQYGTRQGVRTTQEWRGFFQVWRDAAALNYLVMDALFRTGLPAIAFPPSSIVTARDGQVKTWKMGMLRRALAAGQLPVIYGDVVRDLLRGGTILSTEDLFVHLARRLRPRRILLASLEPGVWADYPVCTRLVQEITRDNLAYIAPSLAGSAAVDVTGGMASKVQLSLALVDELPSLEVRIFSGEEPGAVERALLGEPLGTLIHSG
jgi:isopentenyl phosphate kinase